MKDDTKKKMAVFGACLFVFIAFAGAFALNEMSDAQKPPLQTLDYPPTAQDKADVPRNF